MNFSGHPPGVPRVPNRGPTNGAGLPASVKTVELGAMRPEPPDAPADAEDENSLSSGKLKEALEKALEVVDLLCPRRHLKYEVIEEADLVQVQVVNSDDGSIVRKIPSDDIVKLVEQIHAMLANRFEVEA